MFRAQAFLTLNLLGISTLQAAAPFITDDPDSGIPHSQEIYFYSNLNHTNIEMEEPYLNAPALEMDLGIFDDLQVHATLPYAWQTTSFTSPHGLGDVEVGAKYRIIHETDHVPQFSFAPRVELPTGNASENLGNGRIWTLIPFYLQKGFGPWTTYGGGGYALNSQKGMRNYPFAGWVVQRDLSDKFTLGAELHYEGAVSDEGTSSTVMDIGCYYHIDNHLGFLFSAGSSIQGQTRTVGYLGIHWVSG
ncbi:MAG: transporter [Gammaproteobacteria bacterium]